MTDISPEAVERAILPIIRMVDTGGSPSLNECGAIIDTLRAQAARIAEMEADNRRLAIEVLQAKDEGETSYDLGATDGRREALKECMEIALLAYISDADGHAIATDIRALQGDQT